MADLSTHRDAKRIPPGVVSEARRQIINKTSGEAVTFLKYGYETNGEYTHTRCVCKPGGGPPPHYHNNYVEQFSAIEGILDLEANGKKLFLNPGEGFDVQVGVRHQFSNDAEKNQGRDIVLDVKISPAHEGFEKGLYVLYGLAKDDLLTEEGTPKSLVHLALVSSGQMLDTRFTGAQGAVLNTMVEALAAWGRWTGEEDALLRKYWYNTESTQ